MTDLPEVKLKSLVSFPINGVGRTGISSTKEAGNIYLDLDYADFQITPNVTVTDMPNSYNLIWNEVTESFAKVPFALQATAGVASLGAQTGIIDIDSTLVVTGSTLSVKGLSQAFATRTLAAATSITSSVAALVTHCYATAGDGGGGTYIKAGATTPGGFQSADGQWWELSTDHVRPEQFGAKGDGVTDDYAAFMLAHDYIKRNDATGPGGTIFLLPDQRYLLNSAPVFTRGVSIEGGYKDPGFNMDVATKIHYYATQGAILVGTAGVGFHLDSSCALTNTLVMRAGMTFPAANESAFAGLGVEFVSGSNGGLVENCMFLGLNRAILTSDGAQHRFRNINIDCTNGIAIVNALDTCYVDNVHCWPFSFDLQGTALQAAVKTTRSGIGLLLSGAGDWHRVTNFFTFTYDIGISISSCNSCSIQSSHDNNSLSLNPHQYGVYISGTSTEIHLLNTQSAGTIYGIIVDRAVDANTHTYTTAIIDAPTLWGNITAGILVNSGNTIIRGPGVIRNTVDGIVDMDAAAVVSVSGMAPLALSGNFYNLPVAKTTGTAKQWGNDLEALSPTAPFGGAGAATGKSASQLVTVGPSEAIGYITGAGGSVTQLVSKATGVTLDRPSGAIVMNAANLAAATNVSFTLTNSTIAATDVLILNCTGTAGAYKLNARAAAGSAGIDVFNNTAGPLAEAIVITFAVIKVALA